eukprot:11290564-Karenia_brevis.AAC.1
MPFTRTAPALNQNCFSPPLVFHGIVNTNLVANKTIFNTDTEFVIFGLVIILAQSPKNNPVRCPPRCYFPSLLFDEIIPRTGIFVGLKSNLGIPIGYQLESAEP